MRNKLLGLVIASALLIPAAASAGTFTWGGKLTLALGTLPGLQVPGVGASIVTGSGPHLNTFNLPAALGPVNSSVPVTASATVLSVRFSSVGNASGTFVGSGGNGLGGLMGLTGLAKICLVFDPSCTNVSVPVPLSNGLGIGGTQHFTGAVSLTLQHMPWTTGVASITTHDAQTVINNNPLTGLAHGPASGTSSTAAGSGQVQLVTVTRAYTSLTAAFPELALSGITSLHFVSGGVPEPGTLLLLGAGVAGLLAVGRKKSK